MMTVRMYRSTDVSAPQLNNSVLGSLAAIFKACLVTGYGSGPNLKAGAGWTLTIDNTHVILLRNTSGSGRYFKIKDDGYPQVTTTTPTNLWATITGAANYSDINSLITPFPRTVTGTDLHSTTWYGAPVQKPNYTTTPWILIADEKTCYFIYDRFALAQDATNSGYPNTGGSNVVIAFGDLKPLGNVTSNPVAFVQTQKFDVETYNDTTELFGINNSIQGYLEHSLYDVTKSTKFICALPFCNSTIISYVPTNSNHAVATNNMSVFPSPITGGALFERYIICDDASNVARPVTNRIATGNPIHEKFATYPGVFASLHGVRDSDPFYQCCNPFDTLNDGSRQYLVFDTMSSKTLAIDITGPW